LIIGDRSLPEDEYFKDDTPTWGLVAMSLMCTFISFGILVLIVSSFKYNLLWWILVIILSLLTIICLILTIFAFSFVTFLKKVESLTEEEAEEEFVRLIESSLVVKFIRKFIDMEDQEGEMKVQKISRVKMNPTGISLYDYDNVVFKIISWGDIRKIRHRHKAKISKFYYDLVLINGRVVWINAEIEKREGVDLFIGMKRSIKKYRKGKRADEIEFSGRFDYIYYEKTEV
jgi:hypothetical protein